MPSLFAGMEDAKISNNKSGYLLSMSLSYSTISLYAALSALGLISGVAVWLLRRRQCDEEDVEIKPLGGAMFDLFLTWIGLCNTISIYTSFNAVIKDTSESYSWNDSSIAILVFFGHVIMVAYAIYLIYAILFAGVWNKYFPVASRGDRENDDGSQEQQQQPERKHNLAVYLIPCDSYGIQMLYTLVFFFMLMSVDTISYLPWKKSEFTQRSGGFPRFWVIRNCVLLSLLVAALSFVAAAVSFNLRIVQSHKLTLETLLPLVVSILLLLFQVVKLLLLFFFEKTRVGRENDVIVAKKINSNEKEDVTDELESQSLDLKREKDLCFPPLQVVVEQAAENIEVLPPMNKVLQHPFITAGREEPEYDVYVCYREESDGEHAQLIYDRLTSMGVKVFDLKSQTKTR